MRVVFFGLPLAALLLLEDGHELALACISRADAVGLRRLRRRLGERVLVRPDARSPALAARVRAEAPDLLVSWFWTTRLPAALVACARLGGFGVHPSLLPRHRGPDPTYWAIRLGDEVTGVTAHRLAEEYDTGAILAQRRLAIEPGWSAWALARALDRPSLALLREVAARFAAGEALAGEAQDEALATQAPFPSDEDAALAFDAPTEEVLRAVRALSPAPGAWTELALPDGPRALVVTRARRAERPPPLAPGEAAALGGAVLVGTADGAIELLEAELDGAPTTPAALAAALG